MDLPAWIGGQGRGGSGSGPPVTSKDSAARSVSSVVVSKRGADRFRRGQLWVFRSDLLREPDAEPGAIVRILDPREQLIGYGFYGPSDLALRLITREDKAPDRALFKQRLLDAMERRRGWLGSDSVVGAPPRDAFRLLHGEADLMPGWLVDKFGDAYVVQSLSLATDQREPMLIELLQECFDAKTIVVRDDGMTREYEGLEDRKSLAVGKSPIARYHEGALVFEIDLLADQKTGAFLDQLENHLRARDYAKGDALDTFCYHGGFGLQMARSAQHVTCVDQSELAIDRVVANAERNQLDNVTGVVGNAFDVLRDYEREGRRFDTIVIDPPAFAKRKSAVEAAYRGYKDLNLRALKCLNPGGILISCSCSAKMTRALFEEMLEDAVRDAKRKVWVLERRGGSRDHPGLIGMPETEYLKCFVLQVI